MEMKGDETDGQRAEVGETPRLDLVTQHRDCSGIYYRLTEDEHAVDHSRRRRTETAEVEIDPRVQPVVPRRTNIRTQLTFREN